MFVFVALMVIWILLTGSLQLDELAAGGFAVTAVSVVMRMLMGRATTPPIRFTPMAVIALMRYLYTFTIALLRANLDMARRVLDPLLPIHPVVVEVETSLQSQLGRLMLANSITLTPGTLTVDLKGDRLLVHWIDGSSLPADLTPEARCQQATEEIAAQFERHLKGFIK